MNRHFLILAVCLAAMTAGCVSERRSDTPRTGVEQLLLSTAADRATALWDFTPLRGRKVFVDPALLESTDKNYVLHMVRTELLRDGVNLVAKADEAEIIAEPASGGMGTDGSEFLLGLPAIPLVIMGNGFTTPELALYKASSQYGAAKLSITTRNATTGEVIQIVQSPLASSYYNRYAILFVGFRLTDVPGK